MREVRNFAKLPSPNPDDDVEILPQLEHCKSKHHNVWLGESAISGIKGTVELVEDTQQWYILGYGKKKKYRVKLGSNWAKKRKHPIYSN